MTLFHAAVYISGGRCVLGQLNGAVYIGTGYEEVNGRRSLLSEASHRISLASLGLESGRCLTCSCIQTLLKRKCGEEGSRHKRVQAWEL